MHESKKNLLISLCYLAVIFQIKERLPIKVFEPFSYFQIYDTDIEREKRYTVEYHRNIFSTSQIIYTQDDN